MRENERNTKKHGKICLVQEGQKSTQRSNEKQNKGRMQTFLLKRSANSDSTHTQVRRPPYPSPPARKWAVMGGGRVREAKGSEHPDREVKCWEGEGVKADVIAGTEGRPRRPDPGQKSVKAGLCVFCLSQPAGQVDA